MNIIQEAKQLLKHVESGIELATDGGKEQGQRIHDVLSRLVDMLEWKPIDKDTPHDGTMLLLSNINDKWVVAGSYEKASKNTNIPKAGWYNQFECDCPIYPTHWMPIPLPPVGDNKKKNFPAPPAGYMELMQKKYEENPLTPESPLPNAFYGNALPPVGDK